jgi:hypothetical protein
MYIGRVCAKWAQLESAMQDILWQMLGVPIDDGRVITSSTDATRKLQWLYGFAGKHLNGDEWDRLKAILEETDAVRLDRNFIVHGSWCTHVPTTDPMAMSVKEKGPDPTEIVSETFPPDRMRQIWETIDKCKFELMRWANAHSISRGKEPPYPDLPDRP